MINLVLNRRLSKRSKFPYRNVVSKVTISGLVCTGKSTLYNGLTKKMPWPTFSVSQFFRKYANKHQVSLDDAQEQSYAFTTKVDHKTRLLLSRKGNLIIEGWMVGIMADKLKNVLKVLLVCDSNIRFTRFAKREKLNFVQAKTMVLKRENNLLGKLQEIYQRDDFLSPQNYDLVIDTTAITKKNLVDTVYQKLKGGLK